MTSLYYLALDTQESSVAGIITAIAAVFTAAGGLLLALSVLLPVARRTMSIERQVSTVHTIVNQQRTDAQRYNIALAELLRKHDIEIPIDQSLPVTGQPDATPGQPTT